MESGRALLQPYHLPKQAPLVLGVSGGVDSMVLLTLLAQSGQPLIAAHFDHRLRAASKKEGAMVEAYAQSLGVRCVRGQWERPDPAEAAARQARYAWLQEVCQAAHTPYLVVAHHRSDQLETILLQLARSGNAMKMTGLASASSLGKLTVLRPLLRHDKEAMYAYAKAHQVPYAEDASNADLHFARNRVRHQVVPALTVINPQVTAHAERFSSELSGLIALAKPQLAAFVQAGLQADSFDWTTVITQPIGVRQLVLEAVLLHWRLDVAPETVQALLQALDAGRGNKAFAVPGHTLVVAYHSLQKATPVLSPVNLALTVDDTWHQVQPGLWAGMFKKRPADAADWGYVPATAMCLRHRQAGDVLVLPNGRTKKLNRWFIAHKVPAPTRATAWVAAQASQCFWLSGSELFHRPQTDIIQAVLALKTTANDSEDDNGK